MILAVRRNADVVFDFEGSTANVMRLFRDGTKETLGQTVFCPDLAVRTATDVAAVGRGGSDYYVLRGLSDCSLTPGP